MTDLNLDLGQLVSSKLGDEHILVYMPGIGKAQHLIKTLKSNLSNTDYQAIKYAEGELSYGEFEVVKAERREWRAEINRLEDFIQKWS